jgi:protein gp37
MTKVVHYTCLPLYTADPLASGPPRNGLQCWAMAKTSYISWSDAPWNPWYGCDKVGGAESECANCYIGRILEKKQGLQAWGKIYRAKSTWDLPRKMQRKAEAERKRCKLFTCSLSDFFHRGADEWRQEAWDIIKQCPDVDFLVLTKRAHRIAACLPRDWGEGWANVWLGVSVGRISTAHRIDKLRKIPACIRFISAEPLLESLSAISLTDIHWVIVGGESGYHHRPMELDWAHELREKCEKSGTVFYFKQISATMSSQGSMP